MPSDLNQCLQGLSFLRDSYEVVKVIGFQADQKGTDGVVRPFRFRLEAIRRTGKSGFDVQLSSQAIDDRELLGWVLKQQELWFNHPELHADDIDSALAAAVVFIEGKLQELMSGH